MIAANWDKIMAERVRIVESYGAARPFAIMLHFKDERKFKVMDFPTLEEAQKGLADLEAFLKDMFGEACN